MNLAKNIKNFIPLFLLALTLHSPMIHSDEEAVELFIEVQNSVKETGIITDTKCETPLAKSNEPVTEVTKPRAVSSFIKSCFEDKKIALPNNFKESIAQAITLNSTPSKNPISSYISGLYNIKNWKHDVSLIGQPMCETVDKKLISRGNSTKNTRIGKVEKNMNKIAKAFNKLRQDYLNAIKNKESKESISSKKSKVEGFYSKLMIIMANHESLTTADNKTSIKRAKQFAKHYKVKDYKKPPGVKFYYDNAQSKEDSKRNVGLYQFPMSGNISSCIKAWNAKLGDSAKCKITDTSKKNMFLILTASDQVFNSFCGTNKIVQSIGVQVNTDKYELYSGKARRTHKDNVISEGENKGKLKAPKDRCISLFSHTSNTYNHYGTLGFTTSNNTIDLVNELAEEL